MMSKMADKADQTFELGMERRQDRIWRAMADLLLNHLSLPAPHTFCRRRRCRRRRLCSGRMRLASRRADEMAALRAVGLSGLSHSSLPACLEECNAAVYRAARSKYLDALKDRDAMRLRSSKRGSRITDRRFWRRRLDPADLPCSLLRCREQATVLDIGLGWDDLEWETSREL